MGINKFMESLDDANEIKVPKKDYKNKVDEKLKTKFEKDEEIKSYVGMNLLDMGKEKHTNKKIAMSIYFEEEDLKDEKLKTKFEKDEEIKSYVGMNLLDMGKEKHTNKKIAMSIYFEEEDLKLLKAISNFNNTTVNKTVMSILESPLNITRDNLPKDFDVEKLSKEYDKNSRSKSYKKK